MAKQIKPADQQVASTDKIEPVSIQPAEYPDKTMQDNIKLSFGEILICSIDSQGNEGVPFKVSTSTFKRYYQDENKFRVKKNYQQ
jgi:hypothetical protein